ncbi:hypothetical protein F4677DRAFT_46650 [Hypoxylon crocopeplum]|nr:hypothetical protein F4677DRAFT_46650 [Hypoxylon crocopeplum]
MLFSPRTLVSAAAGLLALCNVAQGSPMEEERRWVNNEVNQFDVRTPTATVPGHCSTTIDDFEHTTASVKTHECYTYTRTAQAPTCPTLSCAPRPTDVICPLVIRVSSVTVPCATDCCPTTPTSYVSTGPCPTCNPCATPTQWITYTTGCPGTPTITSATIVTPPWDTPNS